VTHLLKSGLIDVGDGNGHGSILLTEESVFALGSGVGIQIGIHGGLIGVLLGKLIDSRGAGGPKSPLNDPELAALPSSAQKSIRSTKMLAKIPYADLMVINTWLGFEFISDDGSTITFRGLIHKRSIRRFLESQGVEISDR
jgi:hypothetical protein